MGGVGGLREEEEEEAAVSAYPQPRRDHPAPGKPRRAGPTPASEEANKRASEPASKQTGT